MKLLALVVLADDRIGQALENLKTAAAMQGNSKELQASLDSVITSLKPASSELNSVVSRLRVDVEKVVVSAVPVASTIPKPVATDPPSPILGVNCFVELGVRYWNF